MALSNLIWWPWFGVGAAAPPVVAEYHPMGDSVPSLLDGPPIKRSRRRRLESIFNTEEEEFSVIINEL